MKHLKNRKHIRLQRLLWRLRCHDMTLQIEKHDWPVTWNKRATFEDLE